MLIVLVAAVAGPLVYILLPEPSGAAPGGPAALVAAPRGAPAPAPVAALVGGEIEIDDLTEHPIGVVSSTPTAAVDGLIGWPVSDHTPSTGFGYRSDPFTHRQRWHDGVDLGQPCLDPAWASLDGTVAYAGWAGGYGNRVVLRHADRAGHSFETAYSHLSQIAVGIGQQLKQGDVVGQIGSTGRSTACHMHFEVILDGSYVDPLRFLTGDQSKAALSRRVGSRMPQGMPSPSDEPSATASPSPTGTQSKTPTPTTTAAAPSSAGPSSAEVVETATATSASAASPAGEASTQAGAEPGGQMPSESAQAPSESGQTPSAGSQTPSGGSESPSDATIGPSDEESSPSDTGGPSDSGQGSASA